MQGFLITAASPASSLGVKCEWPRETQKGLLKGTLYMKMPGALICVLPVCIQCKSKSAVVPPSSFAFKGVKDAGRLFWVVCL